MAKNYSVAAVPDGSPTPNDGATKALPRRLSIVLASPTVRVGWSVGREWDDVLSWPLLSAMHRLWCKLLRSNSCSWTDQERSWNLRKHGIFSRTDDLDSEIHTLANKQTLFMNSCRTIIHKANHAFLSGLLPPLFMSSCRKKYTHSKSCIFIFAVP